AGTGAGVRGHRAPAHGRAAAFARRGGLEGGHRLHRVGRAGARRSRGRDDADVHRVPAARARHARRRQARRCAPDDRRSHGVAGRAQRAAQHGRAAAGVRRRRTPDGAVPLPPAGAAPCAAQAGDARRQRREVAHGLSARQGPDARHVDAPHRHHARHRPSDGPHRGPRRSHRRRCRRRMGEPSREALHLGARRSRGWVVRTGRGGRAPGARRRRVLPNPVRPRHRDRAPDPGGSVLMEGRIEEVADGVYQIATMSPIDLGFNQYLVAGDEPLLFHTGMRSLFPLVRGAVSSVVPVESIRWITFGHVEADESGSMNQWLDAAPQATVVHGETYDIGGHVMQWIDTPHTPHGWEAGVLYDTTTTTLFCGDLFTQLGHYDPTTDRDIVEPAAKAEDMFHSMSLHPGSADRIRRLADLEISTLALMHGPAFTGDCRAALLALADDVERRTTAPV